MMANTGNSNPGNFSNDREKASKLVKKAVTIAMVATSKRSLDA